MSDSTAVVRVGSQWRHKATGERVVFIGFASGDACYRSQQLGDIVVPKAMFLDQFDPDPADDPPDLINHPPHYTSHPGRCKCGESVECIDITRHYNFAVGNAIKYLWRAGLKGDAIEDLKKAAWYINDEIARREKEASK